MSLENLGAIHPKVKNALQELQGLTVSAVVAPPANPNLNAPVPGIQAEDTMLAYTGANVASAQIPIADLVVSDQFARGEAVFNTVIATDILIVNGLTYTGVNGTKANNTEWIADSTDEAAVLDLVASINSRDGANVTAVANGTTIEITAVVEGTVGNALTFSSPDTTITETGSGTLVNATGVKASGTLTLVNALAGVTVVVDGKTYTAVSAANANSNSEFTFSIGGSDTQDAADLVRAINLRVNRPDGRGQIVATSSVGVVTVAAKQFGDVQNAITLVGDTGITASGATLENGAIVGGFIRRPASTLQGGTLFWYNKR